MVVGLKEEEEEEEEEEQGKWWWRIENSTRPTTSLLVFQID